MGKVIIVFGKICSGKSYYSRKLKESLNAILISPDEITYELIDNKQGNFYDDFSKKLNKYLTKLVGEIALSGSTIIFERGLWSKQDRDEIRKYYGDLNIECELHYVCVDDDTWNKNIEERNNEIKNGKALSDFYLDEGLMNKLLSKWEEPSEDEYDVIYNVNR